MDSLMVSSQSHGISNKEMLLHTYFRNSLAIFSSRTGSPPSPTSRLLSMGIHRLRFSRKASSDKAGRISCQVKDSSRDMTTNVYGSRSQERVIEAEVPQTSETSPPLKVSPSQASPLGLSEVENGINFAIFSQHATAVTLCLSLPTGMAELALDTHLNKTGNVWHISIEDFPRSNVLYGYRMDGPQDWREGHRFDSSVILLDPYAKLVEGRRHFGDSSLKMSKFLGTYDFDSLPFDWGDNYKLPNIPEKDLAIYEMNVRAFTADESSGLDSSIRGSYIGLIEKIPHLLELGINAVELLPVFEFDEFEFQRRPNPRDHMINTWGYSTINFFAPMNRYASAGGGPVRASWEFKEMVEALHGAGIEIYYMMDPSNNGQLLNFSGCGNTLNCNHPVVMELILNSLRHWLLDVWIKNPTCQRIQMKINRANHQGC